MPGASNIGRFQYTGQAWLPEAGLYYYKARMYDPRLGRFLQTDPIGYGDGMNLYAYVGNDPINFTDPWGLAAVCTGTRMDCPTSRIGGGLTVGSSGYSYNYHSPSATERREAREAAAAATAALAAVLEGMSQSSPFSLPTTTDDEGVIVVTGAKMISDSQKYVVVEGRYYLNPNYNPPFEITLGQAIIIPPLIGAIAAIAPEVALFARLGREIRIGDNLRIAPFGNRTGHPTGRWPHYHYRPSNPAPPGQGIGRHRPWE